MTTQLWAVGMVFLGTIVGAFAPVLLKKGSAKLNRHIGEQLRNYTLLCGIALYVLSAIIFIPALRGGDLSVLYPLVSVNYVWVSFLAMKFLGEKMNKFKWLGIVFIILGVSLIGLGST